VTLGNRLRHELLDGAQVFAQPGQPSVHFRRQFEPLLILGLMQAIHGLGQSGQGGLAQIIFILLRFFSLPEVGDREQVLQADRANINEECERLAVHIESFQTALNDGGQVAKRMNFLLQEMHREVNTMGSKTNLMDITQLVIAMKEEVESMLEQIQNLE